MGKEKKSFRLYILSFKCTRNLECLTSTLEKACFMVTAPCIAVYLYQLRAGTLLKGLWGT